MSLAARAARLIGFDPALVAGLGQRPARALALTALSSLPGSAAVGLSAGYGTYLASNSVGLAAAVGVAACLYLANLLRLSLAGGGVAPHEDARRAATWSPRTVPLVMQLLLGAFFAQPLLLAFLRPEHDARVAELRAALAQMHEETSLSRVRSEREDAERSLQAAAGRRERVLRALARAEGELRELGQAAPTADADARAAERRVLAAAVEDLDAERAHIDRDLDDARHRAARWIEAEREVRERELVDYRDHLARSHFLLRRIQLAWAGPIVASLFTGAFVLVLLLPWLLLFGPGARGAMRAYEAARRMALRSAIEAAYAQARTQEERALRRWPTFDGLRLETHDDPPWNRRPRDPRGRPERRG